MTTTEVYSEARIEELLPFISRDVRQFLTDFDSSLEYQCDADRFVNCHPNWVSSEADLNDLGLAVRRYLLAHPDKPTERDEAYEREIASW